MDFPNCLSINSFPTLHFCFSVSDYSITNEWQYYMRQWNFYMSTWEVKILFILITYQWQQQFWNIMLWAIIYQGMHRNSFQNIFDPQMLHSHVKGIWPCPTFFLNQVGISLSFPNTADVTIRHLGVLCHIQLPASLVAQPTDGAIWQRMFNAKHLLQEILVCHVDSRLALQSAITNI